MAYLAVASELVLYIRPLSKDTRGSICIKRDSVKGNLNLWNYVWRGYFACLLVV